MIRHVPALFTGLLLLGGPALAQDDEMIPYPDDDAYVTPDSPRPRHLPPTSAPTRERSEETLVEQEDREISLAGLDDPNVGWGFEATGGLMLIEASRGSLVEARFAAGARVVWEFGRLFFPEALRDGLFADLSWSFTGLRDGTLAVFNDTNYHYLTLAPAFGIPIAGKDFLVYGQLGGGLAIQHSTIHFDQDRATSITGLKPVLQYGVGFRGRPLVSPDGLLRIAFRLELTRFRRHYMDDTYVGLTAGAAF